MVSGLGVMLNQVYALDILKNKLNDSGYTWGLIGLGY